MIVCPRCSKENQDHYKFCLGCGSELPREAAAPRNFAARTPPSAMPAVNPAPAAAAPKPATEKNLQFAATQAGSASYPPRASAAGVGPAMQAPPVAAPPAAVAAAPAPAPAAAPAPAPARSVPAAAPASNVNNCPSCGNPVPPDFKFCGTCGHRMIVAAAAAAPAAAATVAAPAVAARPSRGQLVVINPDGSEGETFPLSDGSNTIGRDAGSTFAADAYLSPTHATFTFSGNTCTVKDENSLNGVYVKLKRDVPTKLGDSDIFRIGQEILRFEPIPAAQLVHGVEPMGGPNPGFIGRLSLVIGRESVANCYPIPADGMHLGRERGDVIFPEDGYVSGLHCRVHNDGTGVVLTDVGSSNGTFVRIKGSRTVVSGDLLLMGQQLFRVQF